MIADLKPYAEPNEPGLPWLGDIRQYWASQRAKWPFTKMDRPGAGADRGELIVDRGGLAADRGESVLDRWELPPEAQAAIADLGERPRKQRLRAVIVMLCGLRDWTTPAELSRWLNFRPGNLSERHLSPMVEAGQLERRYPANLSHPEQAYRAITRQDELRFTPGDTP